MSDSPRSALEGFITQMETIRSQFEPLYKKADDALDAGVATLKPFLANPDRYEQAVRLMLEGVVGNVMSSSMAATIPFYNSSLFRMMVPDYANAFEKYKRMYLDKLSEARDDLLKSLTPGRLQISIFPPKIKDAEQTGFKLLEFQLNIDVSPDSAFAAEALSLDFQAVGTKLQFSSVSPSTRVESVGAYKDTDTANVKQGIGLKSTEKNTLEAGGGPVPAKAGTERADEETSTLEYQVTRSREFSGQRFTPFVIGSATNGIAYWRLLANPQQPLQGGLTFFATALVPANMMRVTVVADLQTRFETFGEHKISERASFEFSTG